MSDDLRGTPTIAETVDARELARGGACGALLVIDGARSTRLPLPVEGVMVLGRGPSCGVVLEDALVSREHAEIVIAGGEATLSDLGSQNGTTLNGRTLTESRAVFAGDVIGIGGAAIVLVGAPAAARGSTLALPAFRQRVADESARAQDYGRPFALLALRPPAGQDLDAVHALLRPLDGLSRPGDGSALLLLPELDPEEALAIAEAATDALPGLAVGLASCPADGCDPDALLQSSRAAADLARPGEIVLARSAARRLEIGGAAVLLADPAVLRLYAMVERLAPTDLPVLVLGETGTGKESVARAVHAASGRAEGPIVVVSGAALAEGLAESELFGHERGAFTGAVAARTGWFEAASGGTLFLDEVGELSAAVQAKLLRVLETGRVVRVGDHKERAVDVRVVSATNRDLEAEVAAGRFRRDLYHRLAAAVIRLPPLRERPCDLAVLARHFLESAAARAGRRPPALSAAAMAALSAYAWPGNVRELRLAMEVVAATMVDAIVEPWHLPEKVGAAPASPTPTLAPAAAASGAFAPLAEEIRALERTRMEQALEAAGGARAEAARLIGMPERTFRMKARQYGLGRKA